MRKYYIIIAFILLTGIMISHAQSLHGTGHISPENQQDWYKAGLLNKEVYVAENIFNVQNAPADRLTDDDKIEWAMQMAAANPGLDIIFFPAGEYTLNRQISIYQGDIVFQGEGSANTILNFYNDQTENCFSVRGREIELDIRIQNPVEKGSEIISIESVTDEDFSKLNDDSWINFYEAFFPIEDYKNTANNYYKSVGQVTRIENIDNYNLHLKDKVSRTNDITAGKSGDYLTLFKIEPVKNVGIENLRIKRKTPFGTLDNTEASNLYFQYAVNCWIRGVESDLTLRHHVELVFSTHIEISGCYFQRARRYAGGGYGYGVNVKRSTTNCLIENNVFRRLRHSMVLQSGANCNVLTYNYSYSQYSTEYSFKTSDSDLTIHGRYPFGNLLEQNHVEQLECDDAHAAANNNGPYNTFVRNVSRERDMVIRKTEQINLLGNNFKDGLSVDSRSSFATDLFGKYVNSASSDYNDWFSYPHLSSYYWILTSLIDLFYLNDISYYYSERPRFLPADYTFPSLGPLVSDGKQLTQNIPARSRKNDETKTYLSDLTKPPIIVNVSGPRYLKSFQTGTFNVNVSGGIEEYTDFRWFVRNDVINGSWKELTTFKDKQSIQYTRTYNFSIMCEVTQSNGGKKSDYISVSILNGRIGFDKTNNNFENIPEVFALQNYPNPFNSEMIIRLALPEESFITVNIFNTRGQFVKKLAANNYSAGVYNLKWNGRDEAGINVNSGMYFITVKNNGALFKLKALLIK